MLEAFRQEKGKLVEPSDDDVIDVSTFAIPREGREREEQQEVIYDNPTKKNNQTI